jgi:hypothetical protein
MPGMLGGFMKKKIALVAIMVSFLLAGCGNSNPQHQQSPKTTTNPITSMPTMEKTDYNQYVKKTWRQKSNSSPEFEFSISKIESGKITGYISKDVATPSPYDLSNFSGTVNKDTAECQFSDQLGNKGNLKLVFSPNNQIKTTVTLTQKSQNQDTQLSEGTFEFVPLNINDDKNFVPFKDQSFTVDLNSWGKVRFVSGKEVGGNHIPVLMYLTNVNGDILFDFVPELPYSMNVISVSFQDVNKDELKDVLVIAEDTNGSGGKVATVYLQKPDGTFAYNFALDNKINSSGNNKNMKSLINFVSKTLSSETQAQTTTLSLIRTKIQPLDAAKDVADADQTGTPYFLVYDYDTTNYLVSGYENRDADGNYTAGAAVYLVDKSSGQVVANPKVDLSKVHFDKYLLAYNKLAGIVIK